MKTGPVKIYLDDPQTTAVDLPLTEYFNRKNAPFTRSELMHWTAPNGPLCSGLNLFVPMSYQKSC